MLDPEDGLICADDERPIQFEDKLIKELYDQCADKTCTDYEEWKSWFASSRTTAIFVHRRCLKFFGDILASHTRITYMDKGHNGHCSRCKQHSWIFQEHNFKAMYGALCQLCINLFREHACEYCGHPEDFHRGEDGCCLDPHCGCKKLIGDLEQMKTGVQIIRMPTYDPIRHKIERDKKKNAAIKRRAANKKKPKLRKFVPKDLF